FRVAAAPSAGPLSLHDALPIYMPPTASGVSVAEALNLLEHFDLRSMGWGSVDSLHLISEAMKITSSDRRLIGGAPQWTTPAHGLDRKSTRLNSSHAKNSYAVFR